MRTKTLPIIVSVFILVASCKKTDTLSSVHSNATSNTVTATGLGLRFGALVNKSASRVQGSTDPFPGYPFPVDINNNLQYCYNLNTTTAVSYLTTEIHVAYTRMAVDHEAWINDPVGEPYKTNLVNTFSAYKNAGLKVLFNVNWINPDNANPNGPGLGYPTGSNYAIFLSNVLGYLYNHDGHVYPDLVVMENEEGNSNYVQVTTSNATKYVDILSSGAAVCHGLTPSIPCTNGGFYCRNLVYLTYQWLQSTQNQAAADAFVAKCLPLHSITELHTYGVPDEVTKWSSKVSQYSGIDFINMHWYEPQYVQGWDVSLGDPTTIDENNISGEMGQVMAYLKSQIPNKAINSNELGQWTPSTTLTTNFLNALSTTSSPDMQIMCWYDGDGPVHFSAQALRNTNSNQTTHSLRAQGNTFAARIQLP
ncbi:MAG: hypothetical protein JO072_02085 [Parafilimonas sp.]|nr:hypothetical protein [Parafilimonas sp.]